MSNSSGTLEKFAGSLSQLIRSEYHIGEEYYRGDVKRGLRNNDGTGVLAGVSKAISFRTASAFPSPASCTTAVSS